MSLFGASVPADLKDFQAEFLGLQSADASRVSRFRDYRQELESSRDLAMPNFYSSDYGRKPARELPLERHNIPLPFGQALTVKHAHRIAGRLPDAHVDRREETPLERYRSDTMERIWWGIVRASGESAVFLDGAWDGSTLGASCYELYWSVGKQAPYIRPIDPTGVYVVKGLDDSHNFQRVYRAYQVPLATVKAEYRGQDFRGDEVSVDAIDSTHKTGDVPMVTLVAAATRDRTTLFALGGQGGKNQSKIVGLKEDVHELGFVPYVVIPNIGPYRDVWGWSDYEFVRGLVAYIPQLMSREADIIRAISNGAMYEAGTGVKPEVIQRILRNGGVISGKREGKLEPVQVPDTPPFEEAHADRAIEFFKMLGFAPDAAWGDGSAGSGSDRGLQLQPLLELTALKQMNWSRGLTRLGEYCFRMIEKMQAGPSVFRGARPDALGRTRRAFQPVTLYPTANPQQIQNPDFQNDDTGEQPEVLDLPRSPKELFQGDYAIRFLWQNRIDPDDPAFVTNELNKFQQMCQSLHTTLERLGVENPEDEIKLIVQEAEKYPWLRQGMLKMIEQQLAAESGGANAQGEGGGAPVDQGSGLEKALAMMSTKDGSALDADATRAALPGKPVGELSGGA